MNFRKNSIEILISLIITSFSFFNNVNAQQTNVFWRNTLLDYEITGKQNINQFSNIIKKQNISSVNRYLISHEKNIQDTILIDKLTFNLSGLITYHYTTNKFGKKKISYAYDIMNRIINEVEVRNDSIVKEFKFVFYENNKDTMSSHYYYENNKLEYKEVLFVELINSTNNLVGDTLKTCRFNAEDSLLWCKDEIRLCSDSIIVNDNNRSYPLGVKIKSRKTTIIYSKWTCVIFEEITKNHIKKILISFDSNERVKDLTTENYFLKKGNLSEIGDKNSLKWVFKYQSCGLPKKVSLVDKNKNIIREYLYSYNTK